MGKLTDPNTNTRHGGSRGEKRRCHDNWLSNQKKINKAYKVKVKPRPLYVGDLVLKMAGHAQKRINALSKKPT